MLSDLKLRNEQIRDIEQICKLTQTAFAHAEHTSHTEHLIVNALRDAQQLTISLVTELDHEIIAHAAISPITISSGVQDWYGLGPVSVAPQYQQQGIGKQLIQHALQQLKALGGAGCVVLGEPDYYAKFGFIPQPTLVLEGVPAEYFQALSFFQQIPDGIVKYHVAFEAK